MKTLRIVKYRLSEPTGFEPDLTEAKRMEQEANETYREGFFHTWTQIATIDPTAQISIAEAWAIIEDKETHEFEIVPPSRFKFIEAPKSQD